MVYVPAGPFIMGTNSGEGIGPNTPREFNDARPKHEVEVAAFYLDKTEVTNAEYQKYCEATHYPPPPHWPNGKFEASEAEVPVTHIHWWEAQAYAAWAGKRLPTEAEWEKAARGTDERNFPWGEKWNAENVVWNVLRPQAVGSKPGGASPYGALDMAGNVFEWVNDWYKAYPKAPHDFPDFGEHYKVIRGGAFFGFDTIARTFYRSVAFPDTRSEWVGLRCAKDAR
jgi:formylglycine-generating enzyme required for sulfatase activity